jgi:uncharacterized protein YbjT (DUF2867 family)
MAAGENRRLTRDMKTNHRSNETTLIIGGTGKTGRRVAERLLAVGRPIRVGSRSSEPAFDWDDERTWEPAVQGVGAAYLTYAPDLGLPGAADRVRAFAAMAVGQGVRRLVLLSGRGQHNHDLAERAVQESGGTWTVVRSAWFAQNFTEGFLADMVADGTVALPAGDAVEPFVDLDDLADVVVAALTEDRHHGQVYEVTGPALLGFAAAVEEIERAIGRPVGYVPISEQDLATEMRKAGESAELVAILTEVFAELRDGRNASLGDGVNRALGRPPRDFATFARAAAANGAWGQHAVART